MRLCVTFWRGWEARFEGMIEGGTRPGLSVVKEVE